MQILTKNLSHAGKMSYNITAMIYYFHLNIILDISCILMLTLVTKNMLYEIIINSFRIYVQ